MSTPQSSANPAATPAAPHGHPDSAAISGSIQNRATPTTKPPLNGTTVRASLGISAIQMPAAPPATVNSSKYSNTGGMDIKVDCIARRRRSRDIIESA